MPAFAGDCQSYIRSPAMKYRLQDLIDTEHFKNLLERLHKIHLFPSAIMDNDGNIVMAIGWQDVCIRFHRKNKECEKFCIHCDEYIMSHLRKVNSVVSYRCPHGLVENAMPIIIEGVHYGNFFTGQFFLEAPDLDFFRERAKRYGFDQDAYLAAVKKAPVWTQEQLNSYLLFIKELISIISESGLKKLKEIETGRKIAESKELADTILLRMHDGFIISNPQDGRIVDVNDALCSMLGYTRDELLKLSVAEVEANDSPEVIAQRFQYIIENGSAHFESRFRRKDGDIIDVDAAVTYLQNRQLFFGFHRDITERKRAEEALRESETWLSISLEAGHAGAWEWNLESDEIHFDARFHAMLGYEPGELPHSLVEWARYHHPDDPPELWSKTDVYIRSESQVYENEHRIRTKAGTWLWVFTRGKIVKLSATGSARLLIGIAINITERKRAEEALKESESKLSGIIEFLPDATFVIDFEGRVIAWNQAMEQMTGVLKEEMIGRGNHEYSIPFYGRRRPLLIDLALLPDEEFEINHYEGVYRIGDTLNAEAYVPETYQGKGASLQGTSTRLRDASGNIVGAIESIRDISNLKHAEKVLRESEEKFRLLVENSNDIIYTLTNDGIFSFVSPAWTTLLGHPTPEVVGKPIQFYIHPDDVAWCQAFMERMIATGQRQEGVEYRVRHADGSWRWHTSNGVTIKDVSGSVVGFEGIARDITEQKQAGEEREKLKAQLLQSQKMEAVGRLAGGVAHDFNNMLGIILGHAELAMEIDPHNPLHPVLEEIHKAGKRSADLTRQLLAFARKQTVAPKVLDLNVIVEGMLKMLRRLIGEDISLSWNPGADLHQIRIDPTQIDQILANLCVNARDAIADVGKVTIETSNMEFDEDYCADHPDYTPGAYVALAVSDNGCGMDKETLSKLFEPFFTTKALGKGTGLGLSTVYGIVKQNNGFINIYSEPGEGTTFRIYLPSHEGKTTHITADKSLEPAEIGTETILLVEDEPAILELSKSILERLGYTVLDSLTPSDAIRIAHEHPGQIHLLLTDVVMPEMNGRDLAKHLFSLHPDIKHMFMSGYTSNVIAHHGVLDEGVHFIQKPFSLKDLAVKVREALDH